ncbi:MAG: acetate--CoA ligase alpha subunit [Anaerolineae bacterium]|jgi:acetyl coenzyme A synthetase (ADP forming)-like protein
MLEAFFEPRSIAVIGASREEGKLGRAVLQSLIESGFPGQIYPINPKADELLGLKAYPSVLECPGEVDLAVVLIPGRFVPDVMRQCGEKGVKGVIVISAGFREVGAEGMRLEQEVVEVARQYGIRMVGPNCLGYLDTITPFNASFAPLMPDPGPIAFMSQSGAIASSILDVAKLRGLGMSRFVSLGNKADLNETDFLSAWGEDDDTSVIMAYLEDIKDGQTFMETARRVTKTKPVISIKSGSTTAGTRAVSSHTGALAGSEAAYNAAFRQVGVIRAHTIEDLFDFSEAFARQPLIRDDGVCIITNAGGPGVMAADAVEHAGLKLAALAPETMARLKENLPSAASVLNPVDVLGDAPADRYAMALKTVLEDPNVNAVVVILTPQLVTQPLETAKAVAEIAKGSKTPIFSCFIGGELTAKASALLTAEGVPAYPEPERAIRSVRAMLDQRRWLERPPFAPPTFDIDRAKIERVFEVARKDGRLQIGDAEAREVMEAIGLRVPRSELARDPEEAVRFAESIGFPVVMKIASPDILHKSDIGGVKVGIQTAADVRDAFDLIVYRARRHAPDAEIWGCQVQQMVRGGREVILGMNRDPQFGPLMMFGLGGIYVEALRDVVFRVAPMDELEVREMVHEIRAIKLLQGVRGEPPADIDSVVDALLRLSYLVTEYPEIVELDINPLVVYETGTGAIGLDMRLVLAG